MADIGTLAIKVSANLGELLTGLAKARDATQAFGSAFSALSAAASAGVGFLASELQTAYERILQTSRAAERLGTTFADFKVLQEAALRSGIGAPAMERFLEMFARKLGEATVAGSQAERVFRRLGLEAAELASLPLGARLDVVLARIRALPTAADRAAAAFSIFGRSGAQVLSVVDRGPGGLAALRERLKGTGVLLDGEDEKSVLRLKEAFHDLRATYEGLFDRTAVALAPALEEIVRDTKEWLDSMGGAEKVAANIAEIFRNTVREVKQLAVLTKVVGTAATPGTNLTDAAGLQSPLSPAMRFFLSPIPGFGVFDAGMAIGNGLAGGGRGAPAGADPGDAMRHPLWEFVRKVQDGFKKMQADAGPLFNELNLAQGEAIEKLMDEFDKLADNSKHGSPFEKLIALEFKLNDMKAVLGDEFDQEVADRALGNEFDRQFKAAFGHTTHPFPHAADQGSKEAVDAVNKFTFGGGPQSAQEKVNQFLQQQTEHQRYMRQYLKDVSDAVRNRKAAQI